MMKPFDHTRAEIRTRSAQQNMNIAETVQLMNYWMRIWRARRKTQRIAWAKALPSIETQPNNLDTPKSTTH